MNEKDNYLKTADHSTEQNCNMIDGILNNAPPTCIERLFSLFLHLLYHHEILKTLVGKVFLSFQ